MRDEWRPTLEALSPLIQICPGFVVDRTKVEWARAERRSDGSLITVGMAGGGTLDMLWIGQHGVALDGVAAVAGVLFPSSYPTPMHPADLYGEEGGK